MGRALSVRPQCTKKRSRIQRDNDRRPLLERQYSIALRLQDGFDSASVTLSVSSLSGVEGSGVG